MAHSLPDIKKLIAAARTEQAIEGLLAITKDSAWHDEVIQQSAKFRDWQRAKRLGVVATAESELTLNRIHADLLEILQRFAANETPSTARSDQANGPAHTARARSWWPYIVGLGVVVGIFAGLAEILGFFEGRTADTTAANTITVLVHGPGGKDDLVLPGRGVVYLIYGDAKVPETINDEGEATFKQIPEQYFAPDARVELQFADPAGEPYRAAHPDSLYRLTKGQYVALEVALRGMDRVEGTVKDFVTGEPLDSVLVRLRGYSYYTNDYGEFTIDIPPERQQQFIDLSFAKPGYERKELSQVPTTTGRPQVISLKPK